jgi:hypothetical protein
MDTTDPPQPLLSQEDSSSINEILNGINNPRLLQDPSTQENETEISPSNSPAKKKSKPSSPDKLHNAPSNATNSQKKRTKKRSSSTNPTSVLKPSKYSTTPDQPVDTPTPAPPHIHKNRKVLIEISIDFAKESLSQFDGDNGKRWYSPSSNFSST